MKIYRHFIFIIIILYLINFFISNAEEVSYFEVSNNTDCTAAAKNIAAIVNTESIAVIFKDRSLLCGILTENAFLNDKQKLYIEEIIRCYFPKIKKIRIEANNALARDIIELSYYSSGKIKQHILYSRFDFLLLQD